MTPMSNSTASLTTRSALASGHPLPHQSLLNVPGHSAPITSVQGELFCSFTLTPYSFSRLDLHESKDTNTVTATFELPGLKSEDVTIDVHHNRVTVSGESNTSNDREEDGYAVRERHYGKFSRILQLPFGTKVGSLRDNQC